MASVAAASAPWKVVLYGQSLCIFGSDTNNSIGDLLMAGRRSSWTNSPAISGFPWSASSGLNARAERLLTPFATKAPTSVLVMIGGTSDYSLGVSGATCVAAQEACATTARALGFDYVVTTTTTPSQGFGPYTTVAAGSDGVDTSTFTGSGTLNVVTTTHSTTTGTFHVATGGTEATITYTGKTGTTFTGCTTTAGGGVMSTGGRVRGEKYKRAQDGNAQLILDANSKFDYVVELMEDSLLDDYRDGTYYVDGVHPTLTGRQRMADLIAVALDAIGVP